MTWLNKTSITAALGVIFGILVSLGVITPDMSGVVTDLVGQAIVKAVAAVENIVGLFAILVSLLHLFQRRATQKLQYQMSQSTLLAAPPGTLPRELQP